MLTRYKEVLEEYNELQTQFRRTCDTTIKYKTDRFRLEESLRKLEIDKQKELETEVEGEKERLKKGLSPLLSHIKELQNLKQGLLQDIDRVSNMPVEEFENKFRESNSDIVLQEKIAPTVKLLSSKISDISPEMKGSLITAKQKLNNLSTKLDKDTGIIIPVQGTILKYLEQTPESEGTAKNKLSTTYSKVVKVIGSLFEKMGLTKETKMAAIGVTGVLSALLLIKFYAILLIAGSAGVTVAYIKSKNKEDINTLRRRLDTFAGMCCVLDASIVAEREAFTAKEKEKIKQTHRLEIERIDEEIQHTSKEYKSKVTNLTVDEKKIASNVSYKFDIIVNDCEKQMKLLDGNLEKTQAEHNRLTNEISIKDSERVELRTKLKEVFMGLSKSGDDRLMISEFVLGFNDFDLITLKHNDSAMNIFYVGQTSEQNALLIIMIIAQCLSNMLPTVVNFTIIDTEFSGKDYMLFKTEQLSDSFNIVPLDSQVSETLLKVHKEMQTKLRTVKMVSENINSYNKRQIELDSLTLDYHIVIFQNLQKNLLSNQQFLQICRTGPTVGIYPIVFLNSEIRDNILNNSNQNEGEQKILDEYLSIVQKSCWSYSHTSFDIEEYNPHRKKRKK